MRKVTPRRLSKFQREQMMSPIRTAIIALRMGRGSEDHYFNLSGQLMIAHRVAQLVQRHQHLLPDTQAAINALSAMFERWKQRTVPDAFISGTDDEVEALDLAAEIYEALLKTTPLKTIRRAVAQISAALDAAKERP